MTEPEIERAIERVRAGSLDDYATVVGAYHTRLRATIAAICPPGVDLNEVAHLSFVEAHRQLARYTPGTNFYAWLCAIARHRIMTECERLRRTTRNQENYLQHALLERFPQKLETGSDELEASDRRFRFLEECLSVLGPEAQELIQKRYSERRPVQGIAAALGRTASAVSVQLHGLRQKLRDCIERKWRLAQEGIRST